MTNRPACAFCHRTDRRQNSRCPWGCALRYGSWRDRLRYWRAWRLSDWAFANRLRYRLSRWMGLA